MATIYYKQNREWKKIQGLGGGGGSGATINRTALYNLLLAGDGINIINTDDITNKVLIEVNGDWKPTYSDSFLVGSEGSENVKIYVDGKLSYANPVKNFTYKLPITSGTSGKTYELLATSNVKTLFGSQSIVGSDNIDLYVHKIFFRGQPSGGAVILCAFQWISSNNLKVSSLTDLKALIGNSFLIAAITYQMTIGNAFEIIGSHISEKGIYAPRQIIENDVTGPMMVWASGEWVDEVTTL